MDFVEPNSENPADEVTSKPEDSQSVTVNEKTEEVVHQIEEEIVKTYNAVESQVSGFWSSASKTTAELQDKYKLEERRAQLLTLLNNATTSINEKAKITENVQQIENQLKNLGQKIDFQNLSDQANTALDNLDSKLEMIENTASKYVSLFGSFFSGIVNVSNPIGTKTDDDSLSQEEVLFSRSSVGNNYGTSRYDTDLFNLHTTASFFTEDQDDDKSFKVDLKTEEISKLLSKYPDTLEKLMNSIVPVKVSYESFWNRYFVQEQKIKDSESKRKELLNKKKEDDKKGDNEDDDDEEFTWDDDEEE